MQQTLAELYIAPDKLKVRAFVVVLAYLVGMGLSKAILQHGDYVMIAVILSITLANILVGQVKALIRKPHLTLHEQGLKIRGAGLFDWSRLTFAVKGNRVLLHLTGTTKANPIRKTDIGAKSCFYNPEAGALAIVMRFPRGTTNISLAEFEERLNAVSAQKTMQSPKVTQHARQSKYTLMQFLALLPILAVIGLMFYALKVRSFAPSDEWNVIGTVLILTAMAAFGRFAWNSAIGAKGRLDFKTKGGREIATGILIGVPALTLVVYFALLHGLGSAYTRIAGSESVKQYEVTKIRRDNNANFLISPEFGSGLVAGIKAEDKGYYCVKPPVTVAFKVKQSWFGTAVTGPDENVCREFPDQPNILSK
jgi:hypothetical protein